MASNLGVGWYGVLALTMTAEDYLDQTSHVFILPQNPGYYPPKWGQPKSKHSEPKGSNKIKLFSGAAPS